jgi:hypothetical protein
MKYLNLFLSIIITLLITACANENHYSEIKTDNSGFSYESVSNDPTALRLYTLDNVLTFYLSKNTDEPKIQT